MSLFFLIFVMIFIVGIIYIKINLPAIKGKIGEKSVEAVLSLLPKNKYVS